MHGRFCQMEDISANSFSPKHSWECYFTVVWNCHPSCRCNSNCHLCIRVSCMMQAHYSYFPLSVLILFQGHSVKVAVKLSLKKNPNLVRVVHTTLFLSSSLLCVSRGPCCLDYCGFIVHCADDDSTWRGAHWITSWWPILWFCSFFLRSASDIVLDSPWTQRKWDPGLTIEAFRISACLGQWTCHRTTDGTEDQFWNIQILL